MPPSQEAHKKLQDLDKVVEPCGTLLILMHDYPDPDALASALLLATLVRERYGMRTRMVYGGLITRAENRTMVQELRMKLTPAERIQWNRYRCIALVDTQPAFGNHSLPEDIKPTVVIDHHPARESDAAPFADIRTDYGATSTILLEYLEAADLELTVENATAVAYAIRSETQELGREASDKDIASYLKVYPRANKRKLAKIFNPKLPKAYFVLLYKALENTRMFRHIAHVHLGEIESPEFVSQVADLLLRHERIGWAIATGRYQRQLFISIRCTHPNADAGNMLKQMVSGIGYAGGHSQVAGGRVPLEENAAADWEGLEERIIGRFLGKLGYDEDVEWKPLLVRDTEGRIQQAAKRGSKPKP